MNRLPYPTDFSDKEWELIEPHLPQENSGGKGRPRIHSIREIFNAIFYIVRSGCAWRLLPHDLPSWKTVYHYFRRWSKEGLIEKLNTILRQEVRKCEGREPEPSAAIVDSQSVKTTDIGGESGYDGGKKINGRKRHILVDTLGLLIAVVVHSAAVQDRDGVKELLLKVKKKLPRLKLIWADGGYTGKLVDWVQGVFKWILEIVKRPEDQKGFEVLPRRWVVERTFGWFGHYRRLSKDYERCTQNSETMIYAAMVRLMLRRLA